jgi:zinc protease
LLKPVELRVVKKFFVPSDADGSLLRMRKLARLFIIVGLLVAPALPAQPFQQGQPAAQAAAAPTRVTSVEGITEYRLANGLQVLLFPDASKPTVTVNMTYMVGSRHEGAGESGMAHLLEHMLFKGTQRHNEIMGELQSRGADFNGTTSYDRTNYFETLQATDDNLRWALDLEATDGELEGFPRRSRQGNDGRPQ